MAFFKKVISLSLILAVCYCCVSFLNVSAQNATITDQQSDRIRSNCTSTKNTLSQLHASDALLRVNRGQTYESILTKLIDKFNGRLSSNSLNNNNLISVTNEYTTALDNFRTDYKTYEEHLSTALGIDCSKQPVAFYDAISSARNERIKVHADVARLNQLIDNYQLSLDQFEKDYKSAVEGLKN